MITLRYFSFLDPVNGKLTKNYGYSNSRVQQNVVVKNIGGENTVVKNETIERIQEVTPHREQVTELTKKEFDALDVSEESASAKNTREGTLLSIQKLEKRFAEPEKTISSEVLVSVLAVK